MTQQNKNFIYNIAYQLVMYIFPLVSAAYVSRVLGAENIGIYSYTNSIVTVFGMFGMLGIPNYGNREVAKVRDDRVKLSETFSSIYSLQLLFSAVLIILYISIISCIKSAYKIFFYIQIIHLLSVMCDITWLFFGLEKFKITLTRNFVIKLLSTALVILLVKKPSDLWLYTVILTGSTLFGQLYLIILSRKIVDFKICSLKKASVHFQKCLVLFIPIAAFSIYRIMDKTMIGALSQKIQLGYYENAERLINIPIMVISALGTVMMPHMAYSIHNKSETEYSGIIKFSMKLAMLFAVYSALGLFVIGRDLSVVLFGKEYFHSGTLAMILSCTIIASAWSNVIRTQYLIPKGLDKIYVISTSIGAVINLIMNLIFIRIFGAVGACIGTIAAEYSIVIYQTIKVKKDLDMAAYVKDFMISAAKAAITMLSVYIIGMLFNNIYIRISVELAIALVLFFILNKTFIIRDFFGKKSKGEHQKTKGELNDRADNIG